MIEWKRPGSEGQLRLSEDGLYVCVFSHRSAGVMVPVDLFKAFAAGLPDQDNINLST